MRVRVENDGLPGACTKITDADTGERINGALAVDIRISAYGDPQVVLTMELPHLMVLAEARMETRKRSWKERLGLAR